MELTKEHEFAGSESERAWEDYIESIKPKMDEISSVLEFMNENNTQDSLLEEWGGALNAYISDTVQALQAEGYHAQYLQTAYQDFFTFMAQGFCLGIMIGKGAVASSPDMIDLEKEDDDALTALIG